MSDKITRIKREVRDFIHKYVGNMNSLLSNSILSAKVCADIYKLYEQMYDDITLNEAININDLNNVLENYDKPDREIDLFKKFVKTKNTYIIRLTMESDKWMTFIEGLAKSKPFDTIIKNGNITRKQYISMLSSGVLKLLKKSIYQFRGCWEIADYSPNRNIKIELFEPDHIEFISQFFINEVQQLNAN